MLRLCLLFQMFVTGMAATAANVHIAVSDIISDNISDTVQTLAEANSIEISVISIGSLPAMDALRRDEISLAVVAVPDDNELLDDTLKILPFAYSTAVVAVKEANPIDEVSFYDLRGIFGSDSDLNVETWGALQVQSLADRLIKPLIVQDEMGISIELFRHVVLAGDSMKLTVNQVIDSEIEEMLVNNVSSIAVLPHLPDNQAIKALMISTNPKSPAFGPTNDNVYYGDYPIRLPFQIVYKKDRESELTKTLRILLSDELTEALRANHLFVPPDTVRASFTKSLDLID